MSMENTEAATTAAPIVVCMKWVSLRPEIDPLTGNVETDERWSGPSAADEAALELALLIGESRNARVVVFTAGAIAAESMLRNALACGATSAYHILLSEHIDSASMAIAGALANVIKPLNPQLVLCGDWSLDRGSGSVPLFLAAELDAEAACGLVSLRLADGREQTTTLRAELRAERRLDGGRRELLTIAGPAVLSVEGTTARLRRATLRATLAAKTTPINRSNASLDTVALPTRSGPFRPRARVLEGPSSSDSPRARLEQLTGALTNRKPPQRVELDPEAAADLIIEQLDAWGYQLPQQATTDQQETSRERLQ
jgi:electron transfer flavoprotein beta subunit